MLLDELLSLEVFQFMIVFARLGAAMMFLPGYAASYINARIRLSIALCVTVLITPLIGGYLLPAEPANAIMLTLLFTKEITIGVFIGLIPRYSLVALDLAGNKIGMNMGLGMANAFDPMFDSTAPILSTFLSTVAVVLLFITNMHHLMIAAIVDSYQIFTPGELLQNGDMLQYLVKTIGKSFVIGFKLASPFIVFSITFQLALGLASRLMPQLNIFFVTIPIKLYLGFYLLIISITTILGWFFRYFEDTLIAFTSLG
jgi:flagellar biosynthetic protein FliR